MSKKTVKQTPKPQINTTLHNSRFGFANRSTVKLSFAAILLIAVSTFALISPHKAYAAINQNLSFEGKVVNSSGQNIPDSSTYNVQFKIYTGCTNEPSSSTGCSAVWTEDWVNGTGSTPVSFTSGTFEVNLGSICPFTGGTCGVNTNTAINWDTSPLYLSINIGTTASCTLATGFASCGGGAGVMNPFILLTASPYAMNAANADDLGGVAAASYAQYGTNNTWTGTQLVSTTSTTALQVGSSSSATVLGVDTSGNQVLVGSNSHVNGLLKLNSSASSGYVGLTVSSSTFTGYNLTLPTAAPTTQGQCLQAGATPTNLTWGSCGGSSATTVALLPEYAGAVFSASGSNNQGYMQSDHVAVSSGYTYNYYDWTTDQTTAQTYDIVTEYQVPSNFNSFVASSMKAWAQVDSTSNNAITVDVHDGSTDCTSGFSTITPSGTTWSQQSMPSLSGCTIAANDVLTFDFRLSATYVSSTYYYARLGELSWQYQ